MSLDHGISLTRQVCSSVSLNPILLIMCPPLPAFPLAKRELVFYICGSVFCFVNKLICIAFLDPTCKCYYIIHNTSFVLLPQNYFGKSKSLWFHIHFRIICSRSVRNVMGNLIGITLNLYIALSGTVIFTVLILLIQERGVSFHFFESCYFPLSVFYSSQCISLSPLWLGLFLCILFYFDTRHLIFITDTLEFLIKVVCACVLSCSIVPSSLQP